MKRFYLTGQNTFGNRGCEAIVRSTVGLLRKQFGSVEVMVPSSNINADRAQWPEAQEQGVKFVQSYHPWFTRYWIHMQRLPLPILKRAGWPFPAPAELSKTLSGVDAVLSVGGDNYSLDYYFPSHYMGLDKAAMHEKKPVILWGASVGPFDAEPDFVPTIKKHLASMSAITVRESDSFNYLSDMGLTNLTMVADPAFTLQPQEVDISGFWPESGTEGVIGLNLSSLIQKYRPSDEPQSKMLNEVASFIRYAVLEYGLSVLLVPHVVPLDGTEKDNDAVYLSKLLFETKDLCGRVKMMTPTLNAAQIKNVISKCRFFMGARTHSTIAALSSCVPTISIAYSVKAKGINKDLFGHMNYVLETPSVGTDSLKSALLQLISEEQSIKEQLESRIPEWQRRSSIGAARLAEILL
jgi:colanic acid/amylovoran biosynthesis protein